MAARRVRPSVITLHGGTEARALTYPYGARTPVLALGFGHTSVMVGTREIGTVSAADVEFARGLAREATAFAASVVRMYRGVGRRPDLTSNDTSKTV